MKLIITYKTSFQILEDNNIKIKYEQAIQYAIDSLFTYVKYDVKFKQALDFVKNNSNLLKFLTKSTQKNINIFRKDCVDKNIKNYICKKHGNKISNLDNLDYEAFAGEYIQELIKNDFYKALQFKKNLSEQILNVIK